MSKKRIPLSTKLSISVAVIILLVAMLAINITSSLFSKYCLNNFYDSAGMAISEFSDSISMFFRAKEAELNVFAESDQVKAADDTIHSFANEVGEIKIPSYSKSETELNFFFFSMS